MLRVPFNFRIAYRTCAQRVIRRCIRKWERRRAAYALVLGERKREILSLILSRGGDPFSVTQWICTRRIYISLYRYGGINPMSGYRHRERATPVKRKKPSSRALRLFLRRERNPGEENNRKYNSPRPRGEMLANKSASARCIPRCFRPIAGLCTDGNANGARHERRAQFANAGTDIRENAACGDRMLKLLLTHLRPVIYETRINSSAHNRLYMRPI